MNRQTRRLLERYFRHTRMEKVREMNQDATIVARAALGRDV